MTLIRYQKSKFKVIKNFYPYPKKQNSGENFLFKDFKLTIYRHLKEICSIIIFQIYICSKIKERMCLIVQKRPSIIFPNFSNCCWYCKRKYINILLVQLKVLTKGNCLDFDGANKSLNCQIYLLFSFFIVVSLEKYINSNP